MGWGGWLSLVTAGAERQRAKGRRSLTCHHDQQSGDGDLDEQEDFRGDCDH